MLYILMVLKSWFGVLGAYRSDVHCINFYLTFTFTIISSSDSVLASISVGSCFYINALTLSA